ncbi:hypothetical protein QBC44DRAFT_395696 [Cladorrhinum sp. PSN332]|nr:hypothetical protein QBC44DRAFT_395696 [Cladorrhinum sp. PSN332]
MNPQPSTMDYDSDESDFYGNEEIISALNSRIASFNPTHHRLTHPQPNLITRHLTPSNPASPSPTTTRLHNRYSHLPQCAWQLTEPIDAFLARLPPATTDRAPGLEWIFIANPYIPPLSTSLSPNANPSTSSLPQLVKAGTARLALFDELTAQTKLKIKSPFAQKQQISKARKELISDLKSLAVSAGEITGKWMLFPEAAQNRQEAYIDEVWAAVAKATANNELGIAAKVEARAGTADSAGRERLICVYTADFRDKNDVARVLKRLRELELVRTGRGAKQVYYKCDAWTELNIYGGNEWEIPASMYSSNEMFAYLKEQAAKKL